MTRNTVLALSALIIGMSSTAAHADYFKLYAPKVDKGEFSLEADLNYSADHRSANDNYLSQVYGFEYGVNDYWMTELSGEVEKETGTKTELTNLKWENVITPFKPGEKWMDAGLYVELEKAAVSGNPNNLELKALLEKDFGQWQNIANIGVAREFGPNSADAWNGSAAIRTAYRLDQKFEPGLEYYADFGDISDTGSFNNQDHRIGPAIYGKIGHVKYDTGVLFGVSDAAQDTTVKLNLEYEF